MAKFKKGDWVTYVGIQLLPDFKDAQGVVTGELVYKGYMVLWEHTGKTAGVYTSSLQHMSGEKAALATCLYRMKSHEL